MLILLLQIYALLVKLRELSMQVHIKIIRYSTREKLRPTNGNMLGLLKSNPLSMIEYLNGSIFMPKTSFCIHLEISNYHYSRAPRYRFFSFELKWQNI